MILKASWKKKVNYGLNYGDIGNTRMWGKVKNQCYYGRKTERGQEEVY